MIWRFKFKQNWAEIQDVAGVAFLKKFVSGLDVIFAVLYPWLQWTANLFYTVQHPT
jgi:hypothetical protein